VLAYFRKQLRARGAVVLKIHGSSMQSPGWPDLLCVHKGVYTWIEIKVGDNGLSRIQEIRIRELQWAGGRVEVFHAYHTGWRDRAAKFIQEL